MLEVRLNGGGGSETFYHFEGVNVADGRYHTVTCIKDGRRFSIYMDDEFEVRIVIFWHCNISQIIYFSFFRAHHKS